MACLCWKCRLTPEINRDVNKATGSKAKAPSLKAKATAELCTATQTSQVHKVYSVATHLDQNPEIGYLYQNIEYCKVLNIDNSFMPV